MTDLIEQIHEDVNVVTSGRLLFRPVWTRPPFDEGDHILETREAGD